MLLRAQELPLTLASQGAGVQGKHGSSCRPLQATSNENRGSGCSGSALGPRAAAHKQACRKQPSGWAAAQHCAQGPCQGSGDTGIQPQILLHCQAQAEKDMGTSSAEGLILRPWIFFLGKTDAGSSDTPALTPLWPDAVHTNSSGLWLKMKCFCALSGAYKDLVSIVICVCQVRNPSSKFPMLDHRKISGFFFTGITEKGTCCPLVFHNGLC